MNRQAAAGLLHPREFVVPAALPVSLSALSIDVMLPAAAQAQMDSTPPCGTGEGQGCPFDWLMIRGITVIDGTGLSPGGRWASSSRTIGSPKWPRRATRSQRPGSTAAPRRAAARSTARGCLDHRSPGPHRLRYPLLPWVIWGWLRMVPALSTRRGPLPQIRQQAPDLDGFSALTVARDPTEFIEGET